MRNFPLRLCSAIRKNHRDLCRYRAALSMVYRQALRGWSSCDVYVEGTLSPVICLFGCGSAAPRLCV